MSPEMKVEKVVRYITQAYVKPILIYFIQLLTIKNIPSFPCVPLISLSLCFSGENLFLTLVPLRINAIL